MTELCPTCNRPLPRNTDKKFNAKEFDLIRQLRDDGRSWLEVGHTFGLSAPVTRTKAEQAATKFGVAWEELEQPSFMGRNDASDYVKIKELRIDAGLPWRMVGEMMGGQSAAWATARWQGLQKKFDV